MRKMLFISKTSPRNMVQYENLDEKEIKKNKRKNPNKCFAASFLKLIIIISFRSYALQSFPFVCIYLSTDIQSIVGANNGESS